MIMITNVLLAVILLGVPTYFDFYSLHISPTDNPAELVTQLDAEDAAARIEAYNALVAMGNQAIPALMESPWVNQDGLEFYGPRIIREIRHEAVEPLMIRLRELLESHDPNDSDVFLRTGDVLVGLGAIGPEAVNSVPLVLEALESPVGLVRMFACQTLEEIQPHSEEVKMALLNAINDPEIIIIDYAAFALGAVVEPGDQEAMEALTSAMDNDEFGFHTIPFAYALYKLGWNQEEMFRIISDCLNDASSNCYTYEAIKSLARINDAQSIAILREYILDVNNNYRFLALHESLRIGPTQEILEILIEVLSDSDPKMQVWAAYILGVFGSEASIALPNLEALLEYGESVGFDEELLTVVEEAIILVSGSVT